VLAGSVILIVAALAHSCASTQQQPNVVLVVIDTLRADHLSVYGYERRTSPNLDHFARSAMRYTRVFSTAPWTLPAHASLFTGKFPFEHGAHEVPSPPDAPDNAAPLDRSEWTLAEELRERGYSTADISANAGYLDRHYGLDQGFATYDVEHLPGEQINRRVNDWLAKTPARPVFLYVNFMETHRPYDTKVRSPQSWPNHAEADPHELLDRLYRDVMGGSGPANPHLRQKVVDQYDTGVRNADLAFGELLKVLRSHGLEEDTIIVVTSDHGEYFGEHRLVEHSKDVYQSALHVPLIMRTPNQTREGVSDSTLSSVNVPGLILAAIGGAQVGDTTYLSRQPGRHPIISENYLSRVKDLRHPIWGDRFQRIRTAIFDENYKLILSSDGQHELFRLPDDPDETKNLFRSHERAAERLTRELHAFMGATRRQVADPYGDARRGMGAPR